MTARLIIFLLVLMVTGFTSNAQLKINGAVKDSSGKPVSYATVSILSAAKAVTAYTLTDGQGRYLISLPEPEVSSEMAIQVTFIGFKKRGQAGTCRQDHL